MSLQLVQRLLVLVLVEQLIGIGQQMLQVRGHLFSLLFTGNGRRFNGRRRGTEKQSSSEQITG